MPSVSEVLTSRAKRGKPKGDVNSSMAEGDWTVVGPSRGRGGQALMPSPGRTPTLRGAVSATRATTRSAVRSRDPSPPRPTYLAVASAGAMTRSATRMSSVEIGTAAPPSTPGSSTRARTTPPARSAHSARAQADHPAQAACSA